jgi:hypothetical protein
MVFLKVAAPVLKTEINGRGDPLRWPRNTLYPQKLALASLTSGGRSVGIVRLRTTSHGDFFMVYLTTLSVHDVIAPNGKVMLSLCLTN